MIEHDAVYDLAMLADAGWLASYLFDVPNMSGCNGVWAVAETAEDLADAVARIESLQHGTLPPDIAPHNETTADYLRARWSEHLAEVDEAVESVV